MGLFAPRALRFLFFEKGSRVVFKSFQSALSSTSTTRECSVIYIHHQRVLYHPHPPNHQHLCEQPLC